MRFLNHILMRGLPAATAWVALALPAAWGQAPGATACGLLDRDCWRAPQQFPYVPCPSMEAPKAPAPAQPAAPSAPAPAPSAPPEVAMTPSPFGAPGQAAALGGSAFATADATSYIDSAIPRTTFRLRFDAAYDDHRPDRAEFFYAKCGCFRVAGLDPHAAGPPLPEAGVDYQDASAYIEFAPTADFSVFAEAPWRFLNPENNANTNGVGDTIVGAKAALIRTPCTVLTAQVKGYLPTGDSVRGLGTHHESVEPGILLYHRLSDRLAINAEVRYWIPTSGSDFSGSVIRYGIGASYDLIQGCDWKLTPTLEFVGWTIQDGKESNLFNPVHDASGETIVNVKGGARLFFGEHSSVAASAGLALTGDWWYKEIWRVEYRWQW